MRLNVEHGHACAGEFVFEKRLLFEAVATEPLDAEGEREFETGERLKARQHGGGRFQPGVAAGAEFGLVRAAEVEGVAFGEPAGVGREEGGQRSLLEVARVDGEPPGAGAAAGVLVVAADGEVGAESVELHGDGAGRVVGVEEDERAGFVCPGDDAVEAVEHLPGDEVHDADNDEIGVAVDGVDDGVRDEQAALVRCDPADVGAALALVGLEDEIDRVELAPGRDDAGPVRGQGVDGGAKPLPCGDAWHDGVGS